MSSQLEQLLGYLDREGVTQVIIGTGRPISMRTPTGFTNITARPLSPEQLANFLRHPEIAPLVPDTDGEGDIVDVQIGRRRAVAQVRKRGHELVLSLSRSETAPSHVATQPLARVATPRTDAPAAPRAKSPTSSRAKSPTSSPRAKSPTSSPRAKSPTSSPRAKSPTSSPRAKSPTASPAMRFKTPAPTPAAPAAEGSAFDNFSLDDGIELGGLGSSAPLEIDRSPPVAARTTSASRPSADLSRGISLDLDDVGLSHAPVAAARRSTADLSRGGSLDLDDVGLSRAPGPSTSRMTADLSHGMSLDLDDDEPARAPASAARPAATARPGVTSLDFNDLGPEDPDPDADASGGFSLELDPADVPHAPAAPARSPVAAAPISRGAPAAPAVSFAPPRAAPSAPAVSFAPSPAAAPAYAAATGSQPVPRAAATGSQPVPRVAAPVAATSSQAVPRMSAQAIGRAESGAFGALVRAARERGASDLHVSAARVTSIRVINDLVPLDPNAPPLGAAAVDGLLLPLLDDALQAQLDAVGYVDFALEAPGGGRLRANISRQQQGLKGTFRLALAAPATLEQLGLPADLAKVVHHHQGLVIIAGPSGQGKTTTLASLVDMLNSSRPYHILTIEDPVEIVHPRKQAVISQRETGRHTTSFARGLKASLREDPDVIVIGELRDRESVEIALTAAETGHLVIATMSTPSASKTIDRLIDMFPPEDHNQVRASIAGALRAIVAQRLLPKRGGGVIPAIELVTGVLPLAVMIREDKLYQLPNLLQRGRAFGMIRFDESLADHVRAGRVEEEAALAVAESRKDLALALHPAAPAAAAKTTPLWGFGKKEQR